MRLDGGLAARVEARQPPALGRHREDERSGARQGVVRVRQERAVEPRVEGRDQALEGEWRWTDGALFWMGGPAPAGMAQNGLFVAWYFREPNNVSMAEHCASLETAGSVPEWYDTRCELAQPFVCESL